MHSSDEIHPDIIGPHFVVKESLDRTARQTQSGIGHRTSAVRASPHPVTLVHSVRYLPGTTRSVPSLQAICAGVHLCHALRKQHRHFSRSAHIHLPCTPGRRSPPLLYNHYAKQFLARSGAPLFLSPTQAVTQSSHVHTDTRERHTRPLQTPARPPCRARRQLQEQFPIAREDLAPLFGPAAPLVFGRRMQPRATEPCGVDAELSYALAAARRTAARRLAALVRLCEYRMAATLLERLVVGWRSALTQVTASSGQEIEPAGAAPSSKLLVALASVRNTAVENPGRCISLGLT